MIPALESRGLGADYENFKSHHKGSHPFHEAVHSAQRRLPRVARKRLLQYQRRATAWSGSRTI
jgi:hypothetical protein